MKFLKSISPYILILVVVMFAVVLITNYTGPRKLEYSRFITELSAQNVESVVLEDNKATVVIKGDSASENGPKAGKYVVNIIDTDVFTEQITSEVKNGNPVKYKMEIRTIPLLVRVIPYVLLGIVAIFMFFMIFRQSQSGAGSSGRLTFGRSNARLYTKSKIWRHSKKALKEKTLRFCRER